MQAGDVQYYVFDVSLSVLYGVLYYLVIPRVYEIVVFTAWRFVLHA